MGTGVGIRPCTWCQPALSWAAAGCQQSCNDAVESPVGPRRHEVRPPPAAALPAQSLLLRHGQQRAHVCGTVQGQSTLQDVAASRRPGPNPGLTVRQSLEHRPPHNAAPGLTQACTRLAGACLPEDVDEISVHHLVRSQVPNELEGMQQGRQRACRTGRGSQAAGFVLRTRNACLDLEVHAMTMQRRGPPKAQQQQPLGRQAGRHLWAAAGA